MYALSVSSLVQTLAYLCIRSSVIRSLIPNTPNEKPSQPSMLSTPSSGRDVPSTVLVLRFSSPLVLPFVYVLSQTRDQSTTCAVLQIWVAAQRRTGRSRSSQRENVVRFELPFWVTSPSRRHLMTALHKRINEGNQWDRVYSHQKLRGAL